MPVRIYNMNISDFVTQLENKIVQLFSKRNIYT